MHICRCCWAQPRHASGCMQAQAAQAVQAGTLQQYPALLPPVAPLQRQQQFQQQLQTAEYAMPGQQHDPAAWQPAPPEQQAALPAFQHIGQQGMFFQDQVHCSCTAHPEAN